MNCHICGTESPLWEKARILKKYEVSYFLCPNCGFVQTEKPYWLDEAYSDIIDAEDIGILARNNANAEMVGCLLAAFFPQAQTFLDSGGGYGIFVRLMRDQGFDFQWYDKYTQNLFARGFEKSREHYDVVTAFELFEHYDEPLDEIKKLAELGDEIIFSTLLLPEPAPKPDDWWYYSTSTGQHISFYTKRALIHCAELIGRYYVGSEGVHIFSRRPIPYWKFRLCISRFGRYFVRNRRKSLLAEDYEKLTGEKL